MKKLLSIVMALCLVLSMSLTAFASHEGRRYTQGEVTYVDTASIDLKDLQRLVDVSINNVTIDQNDGKTGWEKVQSHKETGASIINAKKLNQAGTEWVIRIYDKYAEKALTEGTKDEELASYPLDQLQNYNGDYYVSLRPYYWNNVKLEVENAPNKNDNKTYGPSWFYCGLFDDDTHRITGYAVAQRIKRWPGMLDLDFTGKKWNSVSDTLGATWQTNATVEYPVSLKRQTEGVTYPEGYKFKGVYPAYQTTGNLVQGSYDYACSYTFVADHPELSDN